MSRRVVGMAVLCLALLCSVVIAKSGGLRIAGAATLSSGLVPTVGDCLAAVSGPVATGVPPSPVSIDSIGANAVRFGGCADDHIGEVLAFRPMPDQSGGNGAASTFSTGSDGEWCQQVAVGYRAQVRYRLRDASIGLWVPVTGQRFVTILSVPSTDPMRPRWAACAVISPGLEAYRGSVIDPMTRDPAPAPFGLCRTGDQTDRWVSCVLPHRTQVFGTAGGQPLSAGQGSSACRALIESMTGMTDLSAGGVLRVVVAGGPGKDGTSGAGSLRSARCGLSVVGDGQLTGTLIGIGARPLPLA